MAVMAQRVAWFLLLVGASFGSNILVVFPVPFRSYSALGDSIVRTLTDAGHEVTYVTVFPKEPSENANVTYVDISSVLEDEPGLGRLELHVLPLLPAPVPRALHDGTGHARRALQHRAFRDLMVDPHKAFDAVLAHWHYTGLLAPLASVFACPLVWYTAGEPCAGAARLVHEPASAALQHAPAAPQHALLQRAKGLAHQLYEAAWAWYYMDFVEHPLYMSLYAEPQRVRGRAAAAYEELVANATLLLAAARAPLAQPLPAPANARLIGGHHLDLPVTPLPKKLQTYLDSVKNGAILVDLGLDLPLAALPPRVAAQLLEMFAQLEQAVLWRLDRRPDYLPANVRVLNHAPTLAILSHPNTMMLVCDGSAASLAQAAAAGAPAVAVPLHGDQFLMAEQAVTAGFARQVYFTHHLAWTLREAIGEILANYSYRSSAQEASLLFNFRAEPAEAKLARWVSWAAAGAPGARHLRSPAPRLPAIQRYHLDLCLLAALLLWFLSKVLKVIRVHMRDDDADKKDN